MKPAHFMEPDPLDDDRNERWSLSWKPDGHCDHFTKDAILTHAPAASGVYGLYNFDCQIFIGESADIREVLLRLQQEGDFHSHHLRPTGFSFELCPHASRKQRAAELIARYRPALQTMTGGEEIPATPREVTKTRGADISRRSESHSDNHEFPAHAEAMGKPYRLLRARWLHYTALSAVLLGAGAAAYLYSPRLDFHQILQRAGKKPSATATKPQGSNAKQTAKGSQPAKAASRNAGGEGATMGEEDTVREGNSAVRLVNAAAGDDPDQKSSTRETAGPASNRADKKWSVQISAVPEKDVADRLAQQLIEKGYDSYIVPAEVKGQTYYRVRAGRFDAREEAESMRQSLAGEGVYRDAYITAE